MCEEKELKVNWEKWNRDHELEQFLEWIAKMRQKIMTSAGIPAKFFKK